MKSLKLTLLTFFLILGSNVYAQDQQTQSIDEGTIAEQFEFVIKKSSNWKDKRGQSYEVIKRQMMLTLKSHTVDSLKAIQNKLANTETKVSTQQKEIDELKNSLVKTQDTLAITNTKKDSMDLFGLQMSKTNYNVLMWLIIAALLVFLLLFIYKFKNSNTVTKNVKSALTEIEEEFEIHRRTALEREQKVRRQLQDEINKQKG